MSPMGKAAVAAAVIASFAAQASANTSGAPAGTSGGPFPGETLCTRCHGGSEANSGPGTLELLIGDVAAGKHYYTPGGTVSLLVKLVPVLSRAWTAAVHPTTVKPSL